MNCESRPVGELLATIQDERSFHLEKLGPCFSDSSDAGHDFFCRACRRSILGHSRTWSSCLTRRRPGWLSHLDSASPERLIPSGREPPRHPLHLLHVRPPKRLKTLFQASTGDETSLLSSGQRGTPHHRPVR